MSIAIAVIKEQQEAVDSFTINDDTGTYDAVNNPGGYGLPNELRTDRANYLLVSKNTVSGDRTYLAVTNTDPLNTVIWTLTSSADGWHQATVLSFKKWSNAPSYVVGDAVYYTVNGLYYHCIQANSNINPTSSLYWTQITDFEAAQQAGYTNMEIIDYDFLIDSRASIDLADELYDVISEDFTCKLQIEDAAHPLNLIAMLEAAQSKMLDDKPDQAEQIMIALEECTD